MALHKLPGLKSSFDSTMMTMTAVGHNPGDITHPKRPFVATQSVAHQFYPLSPPHAPPPHQPPPPPPPPPPRPSAVHPQSPVSDSSAGFAAGDVAERQIGPAQSLSGSLGKVIGDAAGGKNHVVWVVSDSHLDKQQGTGTSERKKKSQRGPFFSPFRRMLTRDKRRSATEISSISAPAVDPPSPVPASAKTSSQSLDGQHLLHLVRANDDLTQQLIAKSNAIVNLEANVTELSATIDQMKTEIEQAKTREAKYAEDIRALQEVVANQERDTDAKNTVCKEQQEELARLAEQVQTLTVSVAALQTDNEALKTDNETLKTDLDKAVNKGADLTDQNESQEELIQDLQATIDDLQEQVNFLSTERDSFRKYFATAKVDAAQKSEELREKIVDLLDRQREITASIRKGLPLGRIALKKVLQKTEELLEVKAQKQMLQQKVDFLSNKSFVQDMYIVDLRQVIGELSRVLFNHRLAPGYALRRALIRLNMPFDEVAQTQVAPYRWDFADETTSDESSASDTALDRRTNDSASEYQDDSDARWAYRNRKKKKRTRPQEDLSSAVSGSENDDDDDGVSRRSGAATARYGRRLSNRRT